MGSNPRPPVALPLVFAPGRTVKRLREGAVSVCGPRQALEAHARHDGVSFGESWIAFGGRFGLPISATFSYQRDVRWVMHRSAKVNADRLPVLLPPEARGAAFVSVKRALRVGGWPFYSIAVLIWLGLLWGQSTPGRYGAVLLALAVPSLAVVVWCIGGLLRCCARKRWRTILRRIAPAVLVLALAIASSWWQAGLTRSGRPVRGSAPPRCGRSAARRGHP